MNDGGQKEKKGSVLLLTLVITMIVVTTAVVLSTLIISSIKRSQIEATSFSAYYSAESMIERSLYDLRRERKIPYELTQSPSVLRATPADCQTLFPPFPASGDGSTKCSGSVSYETSKTFLNIKKNQKVRVRVIDKASSGENQGAGASKLNIRCKSIAGGLWVEITSYSLYKGTAFGTDTGLDKNLDTIKQINSSCTTDFFAYTEFPFVLQPSESYIIEIKALNQDASSIFLSLVDDATGDPTPGFGDFFNVSATANNSIFSGQTIRVEVPGTGMASGAGDYVIFSESAIEKIVTCTGGNCT